jgi:CRP/FNR family transcriptional regulator
MRGHMSRHPLQCATCAVREQAVCAALTEAERGELMRIGEHRTLERGDALIDAGEDNYACATLISGALKISAIDRDGTERIVALVHPAGFVGELFTPTAHHYVTALTDSLVCLFPRKPYEKLVDAYPHMAHALLRRSALDLAETRSIIDLIGRRGSRQRVAGLLLVFARAAACDPGGVAMRFDMPLTRGEIAGLLGLTIETVSRRLTDFSREGIIKKAGARGVEILDAPKLEELVR